ncbi:phosphopantetheine-binding protein [Actinoplanes sp. KI2]|uniref:phosphopantetheine-binding protein n=1 Tax=Actinoplanes sp. KI2 TaxID=2983315 RepID=UPI0021D5ED3F|nr:phosphopantetheine-binding protein [Actinoplanes sp. KI2]MCU7725969.1 phosphopantetheine-binding protein [Actinoplanes sp. KI2]
MEEQLLEFLRRHLPRHMVPVAVVELTEFPLTPNKKIDTAALPAPATAGTAGAGDAEAGDEVERGLAEIWANLLGLDSVGIHDHFFRLGGHSLQLMRMAAQVRKSYQVKVPAGVLFEQPTVSAIATYIREARNAG